MDFGVVQLLICINPPSNMIYAQLHHSFILPAFPFILIHITHRDIISSFALNYILTVNKGSC